MKLQSIDVDGFGILADTTLADIDGGLNVVYGSNGSGKSTLLHFLRGVLCGFTDSRKSGLLPPAKGGIGGGSLRVQWDGDVCRFSRMNEPGAADRLRVTLLRNDLETPHPRFDLRKLRTDLIPILYTVGAADVHAVDSLVRQAQGDGIQLIGEKVEPHQLKLVAADVQHERSTLLKEGDKGRVVELAGQRQQAQSDLQQLTDELRQRTQQWESQRPQRPQAETTEWQLRVVWLRDELAAAECDLSEAQERAWKRQPAPRTIPMQPAAATSPTHVAHQRREHIDVQRIFRLKALDRRIDHTRTLLAETARARLEINLQAARIAGSDDTPSEPFLKEVRESLTSLEVGLLELRDGAEQLSDQPKHARCVCGEWQQTTSDAVEELSQRLYQLCERVSRYELRHQKSVCAGAVATIGACELELLQHVEALRSERRKILDLSGQLREWKGTIQSKVEHELCECLEHDARLEWMLPKPQPPAPPTEPPPQFKTIQRVIQRPSTQELSRLKTRVDRLNAELQTAVQRWREARNWRPRIELPADIQALERRIDETRMQLDGIETALSQCQERWRVLSVTGEVIRRVVERIDRDRLPTVIQWASQYLHRLTGGRYVEVCVTPDDHALEVIADDGSSKPRSALSRGTLDQLALSLRLALARAYASRGVRFPLVLDDVLVDTDHERLQAAVTLLQEFAREHQQQIMYLTCQTHLADLFELHGIPVRTLPGSARRTQRIAAGSERSNWAIRGWVDRRTDEQVRPAEPITVERPAPLPAIQTTEIVRTTPEIQETPPPRKSEVKGPVRLLKPLNRRQPDGPYWLSMDAPVDLVPSVGSQMGRRMTGLGVHSIADLIDLETEDLTLRLTSLQITPERLRDWQAEAMLLCCVPDLTGPDAQLLVVLGIRDAEQLSRADVDGLLRQIEQLSDAQRIRIGYTTRPSREVVQRWIHSSRRSRSLRDARRFSRSRGRSASGQRASSTRRSTGRRSASASRGRSDRSGRRTSKRRRQSSVDRLLSREPRGQDRKDREREDRDAMITPFVSAKPQGGETHQDREWRFYLSPESPVVDAPSIGPTTARRLEKIGVITVSDLLNRSAEDIAQRLKNRRVKAETVLMWQRQSRLMCRIPLLRGHDAQVLIACDILEPEQVAGMTPDSLFAIVGPFVETVEGQRLLRSSKTPDLEEVTDWITWSRHSRHLRAA